MTLRFAYELGFALVCTIGMLAALLGGQLPEWAWVFGAAPIISAVLHSKGKLLHAGAGTALAVGSVVFGVGSIVQLGTDGVLPGGGVTLLGVLSARILTRQTGGHDVQAILLTLLLIFAGAALHTQGTYAVVFVSYAVAVTWALATRQLVAGAEREALREGGAPQDVTMSRRDIATPTFFAVTAGVALIILLSTSVIFVLFPRVGFGRLGIFSRNNGGFPTEVSLSESPRAGGGGDVLSRVRLVPYADYERGLYLRGPVYDVLTRRGFRASADPRLFPRDRLRVVSTERPRRYEVFTQPIIGEHLLALGPYERANVFTGGYSNPSYKTRVRGAGPSGEIMAAEDLTGPVRYWVVGTIESSDHPVRVVRMAAEEVGDPTLSLEDPRTHSVMNHYLRLPAELDPRVLPLATRLVGAKEGDFPGRVERLRRFLLTDFQYSLEQTNGEQEDPLASFLFEDRRGHCEYFATAFAALLRAGGIPSRVVGGLQGGMWDDEEDVVVFTGAHAHAWVEWFYPGFGWVVDDATPASSPVTLSGLRALLERMGRFWDDNIVDYGLTEQLAVYTRVFQSLRPKRRFSVQPSWRRLVGWFSVPLFGVGLTLLWRRRRRRRSTSSPILRLLLRAIERRTGEAVHESATLREVVEALPADADSRMLREVLRAYEESKFAGRSVSALELQRLRGSLSSSTGGAHKKAGDISVGS